MNKGWVYFRWLGSFEVVLVEMSDYQNFPLLPLCAFECYIETSLVIFLFVFQKSYRSCR